MDKLTFEKVDSLHKIRNLRSQYLAKLIEPQELHLEMLVRNAQPYLIKLDSRSVGYFLLDDEAMLLEYYVQPACINQVDTIFGRILKTFQVQMALCKSFDHTLLACCMAFQIRVSAMGILFREQVEKSLPIPQAVVMRPASSADVPVIAAVNEEVFEKKEEIEEYVSKRQIFLFEQDKELIGFGIFAPVIEGRLEYDIGMLVTEPYRGQGYGTYIIGIMANYCRKNGFRPICGCAIDNEGSRRCLEKAGFISRYRLLRFSF